MVEILKAGADIVVCQDFETRIVEDVTFGGMYYAPYACLKIQDTGNIASALLKLNEALGGNARLDTSNNYVWNKRQDALEKENGEQGKAMGTGTGGR